MKSLRLTLGASVFQGLPLHTLFLMLGYTIVSKMKSLNWVCASIVEPTPEAGMDRSLEPVNLKPDWTISQSHTHIPPPDKLSYIQPLK